MQICLSMDHREWSSLEEVIRLFSDHLLREGDSVLFEIPGADGRYEIRSSLSRPFSSRDARDSFSEAKLLTKTEVEGGPSCQAEVAPKAVRKELKRQLYILLSSLSGMNWPWGSLTGIRPTQPAMELLERLDGNVLKAEEELVSFWKLSPQKAKLALKTAAAERQVLDQIEHSDYMVYAGVPFCPGRCSYCSFISRDAGRYRDTLPEYARALAYEAERFFSACHQKVSAFYLGGGTPTSLESRDFAYVLEKLLTAMPLCDEAELTVEAGRPDTISREKLQIMKSLGIQRICINPQSFRAETLTLLGRRHSPDDIRACFHEAREMGFDNINMDLIAGLPGETPEDFLYSLGECFKLEPESITLHTLALKRSARLQENEKDRWLALRYPDPQLSSAMQLAQDLLEDEGYTPYYLYRQKNVRGGLENVGYTRTQSPCKYNVGMMSDEISVIGLGSGSSSKRVFGRRVERCHNTKDIKDYVERIEELAQRKIQFFRAIGSEAE